MKVINLLDEKTINKIAAGEVVERPFSIIKELVENSIDSGASEITIEVKKDPLRYIRVSDNGSGISHEDIEYAFMRHATSKIKDINDVECIRSLGFRGEALSSISAISRLEMITKQKEDLLGKIVQVEGGKIITKEDAGCPNGTTITIRDVFFNTPARLKFLKSSSKELSSITDLVEKIALSNTNISFRYKIDEKLIFVTSGNGDLSEVIRTIFGKNTYNNIISIEDEDEILKVTGYIGNTSVVKGNRSLEIVFVNGRVIKSPLINSAVEKAYKSMLPINKFPFFILNIEIDPRNIDVNVHPSKAEIKFQDDSLIFKKIYRVIKNHIEKEIDVRSAFDEELFKENVSYTQGTINYDALKIDKPFEVNLPFERVNVDNFKGEAHLEKGLTPSEGANIISPKDLPLNAYENAESYSSKGRTSSCQSDKGIEQGVTPPIQEGGSLDQGYTSSRQGSNLIEKGNTPSTSMGYESLLGQKNTILIQNDSYLTQEVNISGCQNICSGVGKTSLSQKNISLTQGGTPLSSNNTPKTENDTSSAKEGIFFKEENNISKKQDMFLFEAKEEKNQEDKNKIPSLRILGQVNSTFIIGEGAGEMYIIDQHAAHERIYYEKYTKEFNDFAIGSQPLLVPIAMELTLSEKQLVLSNIDSFKQIGFTIDDFGGNSIAIREVPVLYGNPNFKELFNEILEDILDSKEKKIVSCIDKVIYSMACKSAVKAGDSLSIKEMETLMENLNMCESPYTCPHGRPTIIKMSYMELEKKFKRIQ